MEELLLRFFLGGLIVSVFAVVGDAFEPKSFAGIFGAAPSVALATLALTISSKGKHFAATELRSTIIGAGALVVYASLLAQMLMHRDYSAKLASSVLIAAWLMVAIGAWAIWLR